MIISALSSAGQWIKHLLDGQWIKHLLDIFTLAIIEKIAIFRFAGYHTLRSNVSRYRSHHRRWHRYHYFMIVQFFMDFLLILSVLLFNQHF